MEISNHNIDKDQGCGSWGLTDGYFQTQNTGFPKALKKAPSQQAIPECSAYSPPGFPEWDV